jgi:hypothetical protein
MLQQDTDKGMNQERNTPAARYSEFIATSKDLRNSCCRSQAKPGAYPEARHPRLLEL